MNILTELKNTWSRKIESHERCFRRLGIPLYPVEQDLYFVNIPKWSSEMKIADPLDSDEDEEEDYGSDSDRSSRDGRAGRRSRKPRSDDESTDESIDSVDDRQIKRVNRKKKNSIEEAMSTIDDQVKSLSLQSGSVPSSESLYRSSDSKDKNDQDDDEDDEDDDEDEDEDEDEDKDEDEDEDEDDEYDEDEYDSDESIEVEPDAIPGFICTNSNFLFGSEDQLVSDINSAMDQDRKHKHDPVIMIYTFCTDDLQKVGLHFKIASPQLLNIFWVMLRCEKGENNDMAQFSRELQWKTVSSISSFFTQDLNGLYRNKEVVLQNWTSFSEIWQRYERVRDNQSQRRQYLQACIDDKSMVDSWFIDDPADDDEYNDRMGLVGKSRSQQRYADMLADTLADSDDSDSGSLVLEEYAGGRDSQPPATPSIKETKEMLANGKELTLRTVSGSSEVIQPPLGSHGGPSGPSGPVAQAGQASQAAQAGPVAQASQASQASQAAQAAQVGPSAQAYSSDVMMYTPRDWEQTQKFWKKNVLSKQADAIKFPVETIQKAQLHLPLIQQYALEQKGCVIVDGSTATIYRRYEDAVKHGATQGATQGSS